MLCRLADEIDRPHRGGKLFGELVERLALQRASENETEGTAGIGGDATPRRGRVGRLRVVDEPNAVELGHQLEAVLDPRKRAERLRDRVLRDARSPSGCRRRGGVLAVVLAGDERLRRERIVRAKLDAVGTTWDRSEAARNDRDVGLGLVLEDPQLRVPVGVEGLMAVEVVRLEIEQHGNAGTEAVHVLELEARQLADDPGVLLQRSVEARQGPADIAGDCYRCARGAEHRTE